MLAERQDFCAAILHGHAHVPTRLMRTIETDATWELIQGELEGNIKRGRRSDWAQKVRDSPLRPEELQFLVHWTRAEDREFCLHS